MNDNQKYLNIQPIERKTPILWGENGAFNKKLIGSTIQIIERLKAGGYSVMTGTEQEFTLEPHRNMPDDFLAKKRESLSAELIKQSVGRAELLERRLDKIKIFTAQELLALELHLALPGILELRFGRGTTGKPFYDAHGVFEVGLLPKNPLESVANYNKFVRTLEELGKEYSQKVVYWKRDFSYSVTETQTQKNLMDISDGCDERACRMVSGVLAVMHDSTLIFVKKKSIETTPIGAVHSAGFSRNNQIRTGASKNCFEIRVNHNPLAGDNLMATTFLVLSGIKYGLYDYYKDSFKAIPKAHIKRKTIFTSKNKYDLFFTKEILNGAEIKDGVIRVDRKDMFVYGKYLSKEWGLEDTHMYNFLGVLEKAKITKDGNIELPELGEYLQGNIGEAYRKLAGLKYNTQVNTIENKGFSAHVKYQDDDSMTDPLLTNLSAMINSQHLRTVLSESFHSQIIAETVKFYNISKDKIPTKRSGVGMLLNG